MATVVRLTTLADLGPEASSARVDVSALHEAVLDDGRCLVLLDDRGWSSSGTWAHVTADDVEGTTRMVVGPDEPFEGQTQEDMEAGHWGSLAAGLAEHGVAIDGPALRRLPHEVVLSERLLARLGPPTP